MQAHIFVGFATRDRGTRAIDLTDKAVGEIVGLRYGVGVECIGCYYVSSGLDVAAMDVGYYFRTGETEYIIVAVFFSR